MLFMISIPENVGSPDNRNVTLPLTPMDMVAPSTTFFCGVVLDTPNYTTTWTTPTGIMLQRSGNDLSTEFGGGGKYTLSAGPTGVLGFPQGSFFTILRLIHSDAGEYTCSVTFTDSGTTETVPFQLNLKGMWQAAS